MQLLIGHGQVPTIMPEASKKPPILWENARWVKPDRDKNRYVSAGA